MFFLRANNVVHGASLEGMRANGSGYGDSYLVNPNGQIVAAAGLYQEYLMIYNFDLQMKLRSRPVWRSRKSAGALLGYVAADGAEMEQMAIRSARSPSDPWTRCSLFDIR